MDVTRIWIRQVRNFGRSIIPDQLISLIFIMIQIIKKMLTQHVQQIKRHVLHKASFFISIWVKWINFMWRKGWEFIVASIWDGFWPWDDYPRGGGPREGIPPEGGPRLFGGPRLLDGPRPDGPVVSVVFPIHLSSMQSFLHPALNERLNDLFINC